jgi:hypothetical protein
MSAAEEMKTEGGRDTKFPAALQVFPCPPLAGEGEGRTSCQARATRLTESLHRLAAGSTAGS